MSKSAAKSASPTATPPAADFADIAGLSFEAAMKELESIVRALESGTGELERSIADFQRGNALKAHCLAKLAEARLKVEQVQAAEGGAVQATDFAHE